MELTYGVQTPFDSTCFGCEAFKVQESTTLSLVTTRDWESLSICQEDGLDLLPKRCINVVAKGWKLKRNLM